MRISDWSSDVCSSDLLDHDALAPGQIRIDRRDQRGQLHADQDLAEEPLFGGFEDRQRSGLRAAVVGVVGETVRHPGGIERGAHIGVDDRRSEEHTSELQSLMRISYAVFCLKKKKKIHPQLQRSSLPSSSIQIISLI